MRGDLALVLQSPLLLAVTARVVYVELRAWSSSRRRHREIAWMVAGLCPDCGYDLRATPECCPECGTATPQAPTHRTDSQPPRLYHRPRVAPRRIHSVGATSGG
jgi:predicted Zn-ribbon and HTH transcriptional regulator